MTQHNRPKKSKIPYLFFIFFGVIFTVDAVFVYLSKKTWRGVVVQDAYEQGLHYNDILAQQKKQRELGWKMAMSFQDLGNKQGRLLIHFFDQNAQPIKEANITVNVKRPTQEGHDFVQDIPFVNDAYQADITFPLIGQWDFEVSASYDGQQYEQNKRYVIR